MNIVKTSIGLLLCISWIFVTSYHYYPINSAGELLSFRTGLLSIDTNKPEIENRKGEYQPKIHLDDLGIPHIYGEDKTSLAFGLGYMHAKDRYFQMEIMSRMVLGELSGILGEQGVDSDINWKPYGFKAKANEVLEEYKQESPELFNYLVAYSKGVNNYLNLNKHQDPLFKIFDITPRKWRPEYSLLVTWYMSSNLAYFDYHEEQQEIIDKLPHKLQDFFYPLHPKDLQTILPSIKKDSSIIFNKNESFITTNNNKKQTINSSNFVKGVGSNNWVVTSKKAKNKKGFLVNDPHLFLTFPGPFYEAHLSAKDLKVYGYSIPGIPFIVSGHNNEITWGITNGEWDLTDRYELQVKKDSLYYYEDKWVPFEYKEYQIDVRGLGKKKFTQKNSIQGKVIKESNGKYYAQKWYASEKSYSVKALYEMMQSNNWEGFKESLELYDYPPQNFIYNDIRDNIGIVCAGKLPNRDKGFTGGVLDGTKSNKSIEPKRKILWEEENPSDNFLFSANQQLIQNDFYFGAHWHKDDFRVNHIYKLLKEKNDWDVPHMKQIQNDRVDYSYKTYNELFNKYNVYKSNSTIKTYLKDWDGKIINNSAKAHVFEVLRKSTSEVTKNFATKYLQVQQSPSIKSFLKYLKNEEIQVANSPEKSILLNQVLKKMDSVLINDVDFKNEKYNTKSDFEIYNISFLPGFSEEISGMGGNKNTINMNADAHPAFRAIFELSKNGIKGHTIMAGGQSGCINSQNYKDQLTKWKEGKYNVTQYVEDPKDLKNITAKILFKK